MENEKRAGITLNIEDRSSSNDTSYIVNNAVWREKSENGEVVERKLTMYDKEHLNQFYNLCYSMVNSNNKLRPGKAYILSELKKQKEHCNIELFIRWMISKMKKSRYSIHKMFQEFIESNLENHPNIKSYKMGKIIGNCPDEFSDVTIGQVMNGCMEALGAFNKRKITRAFICSMGVFINESDNKKLVPTNEERAAIANYYNIKNIAYRVSRQNLAIISKCDLLKLRLGMKLNEELKFNVKGLSVDEFKAAISINNMERYSLMTDDQLLVLRNRLIPVLENSLTKQIETWRKRMRNIEVVAQSKGYQLTILTGEAAEQ